MSVTTPPALDPSEALLGINNGPGLYIAPASAGAQLPAELTDPWASPWVALGYISDDGVTVAADVSSDAITPWQSTSPIRQVITGKAYTMAFNLWQTNPQNMGIYFDSDTSAATDPTDYAFDVRSDQGGFIYSVGLDILDGDKATRIVFPRAQLSDNDDVTVARGSIVGWGVTLSALDDAGVLAHIVGGTVTGGATGTSSTTTP